MWEHPVYRTDGGVESMTDLDAVYQAIDANDERFVADLQRAVRQPSISSQNIGVRECAALLVAMMQDLGIEARMMETPGLPIVYGEMRAPRADAPTLVIYNHYDVQPAEPLDEWTHPPFAADIVDGVMYGRGTTDAKGNLFAHLKAVDAFQRAGVPLPCHLKFLFDGEEESGSPPLSRRIRTCSPPMPRSPSMVASGRTTGRRSVSGRAASCMSRFACGVRARTCIRPARG